MTVLPSSLPLFASWWTVGKLVQRSPAHLRTVVSGAALLAPEVARQRVGRYATPHPSGRAAPHDGTLTLRELPVVRLIAEGLSGSEIGAALVISLKTVKTYVSRILTKLQLRDRV